MNDKHNELGKKILTWAFIGIIILSIYAMGRVHGAFDVAFNLMSIEGVCLSANNTYSYDKCIISPEKEFCYELAETDTGQTILCINKKVNIISKGVVFIMFGMPLKQLEYNYQDITI